MREVKKVNKKIFVFLAIGILLMVGLNSTGITIEEDRKDPVVLRIPRNGRIDVTFHNIRTGDFQSRSRRFIHRDIRISTGSRGYMSPLTINGIQRTEDDMGGVILEIDYLFGIMQIVSFPGRHSIWINGRARGIELREK